MDFGGLLGSMAFGAMAGYGEGALEQIQRETAMAERKALTELAYDFQREMKQMDIDALDARETRRMDFESGEAAEGRKHQTTLAEMGFSHDEEMLGKKMSREEALLNKQIEASGAGSQLKSLFNAFKEMGFDDDQAKKIAIYSIVGKGSGPAKGKAMKPEDAMEWAFKKAGVADGVAPTEEQQEKIDQYYEEFLGANEGGAGLLDMLMSGGGSGKPNPSIGETWGSHSMGSVPAIGKGASPGGTESAQTSTMQIGGGDAADAIISATRALLEAGDNRSEQADILNEFTRVYGKDATLALKAMYNSQIQDLN